MAEVLKPVDPKATAGPVDERLRELIERARSGDEEPFWDLTRALAEMQMPDFLLARMAGADEAVLRRAVLVVAHQRGSRDAELLGALRGLADDPDEDVRRSHRRMHGGSGVFLSLSLKSCRPGS